MADVNIVNLGPVIMNSAAFLQYVSLTSAPYCQDKNEKSAFPRAKYYCEC